MCYFLNYFNIPHSLGTIAIEQTEKRTERGMFIGRVASRKFETPYSVNASDLLSGLADSLRTVEVRNAEIIHNITNLRLATRPIDRGHVRSAFMFVQWV